MQHQSRHSITFVRARRLRKNMTVAERVLWTQLRKRKIGRFKFRRQVPIGYFIVDFLCAPLKLIIEVDGVSHLSQQNYDARRTRWLESQGYQVIRVSNEAVLSNPERACQKILEACLKCSAKFNI